MRGCGGAVRVRERGRDTFLPKWEGEEASEGHGSCLYFGAALLRAPAVVKDSTLHLAAQQGSRYQSNNLTKTWPEKDIKLARGGVSDLPVCWCAAIVRPCRSSTTSTIEAPDGR